MNYPFFSRNGEILPAGLAAVGLDNVAYSYGYGVYETIRVSKSKANFLDQHAERLMESARIIGLEHGFTNDQVANFVEDLVAKNKIEACNIKVLLVGGRTARDATLYVICLNPLFPDRKLYRTGVHTICYNYEREFPHAKSLNMLSSYLAYRDASKAGAYDALLISKKGNILEGTRTNFFALKDKTIYSPPSDQILLGVTRDNVLKVATKAGFTVVEQDLPLKEIQTYDSIFLTSTSTKIMPIKTIDKMSWELPNQNLSHLMQAFDQA